MNFRYFRLEELIALEGDAVGSEVGQEDGSIWLSDLIHTDPMSDFCYTHHELPQQVDQQ